MYTGPLRKERGHRHHTAPPSKSHPAANYRAGSMFTLILKMFLLCLSSCDIEKKYNHSIRKRLRLQRAATKEGLNKKNSKLPTPEQVTRMLTTSCDWIIQRNVSL